jgi:hypothetical protein
MNAECGVCAGVVWTSAELNRVIGGLVVPMHLPGTNLSRPRKVGTHHPSPQHEADKPMAWHSWRRLNLPA